MRTILHTYYPPSEELKILQLNKTIWTHANCWDSNWSNSYGCSTRFIIPNKGKDLGGKLFGIKVLLEQESDDEFVLFLHDKKSPQVIDGERWKKELWSIGSKEQIAKATKIFKEDPSVGIVAQTESIVQPSIAGEDFAYAKNKELLFAEAKRYNILPADKSFVAGTMFIARLQPYLEFFKLNDPLLIRSNFENGNVLDLENGTYTHSWERLLSWILTSKGYKIAGI